MELRLDVKAVTRWGRLTMGGREADIVEGEEVGHGGDVGVM